MNSFAQALKAEYVAFRCLLNDHEHRSGEFAPDVYDKRFRPVFGRSAESIPELFASIGMTNEPVWGRNPQGAELLQFARERLPKMKAADYANEAKWLNDAYRQMAAKLSLPRNQRSALHGQLERSVIRPDITLLRFIPLQWADADTWLAEAETRIAAAVCLVAIRRWQITGPGPLPTDLSAILAAAGISEVPADPIAGGPLGLAILEGQPVVYSRGVDGVDDHALKDARIISGRRDLLFRIDGP